MPRRQIAAVLLCAAPLHACADRPAESAQVFLHRIEYEASLAAVARLPACGDSPRAPAKWVRHDARLLSFQLPPQYREREGGRGIDSYVREYIAPGRRIMFDYGGYSASLSEGISDLVEHRACRVLIDGNLVRLVTARTPEGAYFAGAAWREIIPKSQGDVHLTMTATSETAEGQREALAIFRSVVLSDLGSTRP